MACIGRLPDPGGRQDRAVRLQRGLQPPAPTFPDRSAHTHRV